jgi:accessory colonization factor AcfC
MIIVKTKTGTHFVNDKAVRKVWHDKNNAKVWITDANGGIDNITDVEMVTYTSDMMKVDYQDKGSMVEYLEQQRSEMYNVVERYRAKLRDFGCEL